MAMCCYAHSKTLPLDDCENLGRQVRWMPRITERFLRAAVEVWAIDSGSSFSPGGIASHLSGASATTRVD